MKQPKESKVRLLSVNDVAEILGSRMMAYRLFKVKDFPKIQLGVRSFVREDSFEQWVLEHEGGKVHLPVTAKDAE